MSAGSLARELIVARDAALEAGAIVLGHYQRGLRAHEDKADRSPVTQADLESSAAITRRLAQAFPGDAIVSEEAPPTPGGERVWIVDPLDGTRDFLERTGDFAVLIGLAIAGTPVLGVVHAPVLGTTCLAVRGGGAWRDGSVREPLRVAARGELAGLRGAVGRMALPEHVHGFIAAAPFPVARVGAAIKYLRVATGELDAAFWLTGRESLWDSCAPEVLVREAGGRVTDVDGAPLRYDPRTLRHGRGIVASSGAHHDELLALARAWFRP